MLALIVPFLVSLWIDVLWAGDHKGPPPVHSTALAPTGKEKQPTKMCAARSASCSIGYGNGAAGSDPRWLWRVRRGHRVGLWEHSARAALHFSQAAQCRGQVPGGTQRGGEQGDEKTAHGAGQRHLSGREGRRSETVLPLPDTVTNSALLPTPPMFNGALVGVTPEAVPSFRTFWFSGCGVSDFVP